MILKSSQKSIIIEIKATNENKDPKQKAQKTSNQILTPLNLFIKKSPPIRDNTRITYLCLSRKQRYFSYYSNFL